jgi:hypothetical protein
MHTGHAVQEAIKCRERERGHAVQVAIKEREREREDTIYYKMYYL